MFSWRWIPNRIALFQNTSAFNKFSWSKKEKWRNVSTVIGNERHDEVSSIWILLFVSLFVVIFRTSIFLFKRNFYYFINKIFFGRSLPIKKIFVRWKFSQLSTYQKSIYWTSSLRLSVKCLKILRVLEKPYLLN